jgi:hypothetical protein
MLTFISCKKADLPAQFNETSIKATMSSFDAAIQSGVRGHFCPGEFNRLFPDAFNTISYYNGLAGKPNWYSKAGLHRRYVLKMEVEIELDSARTDIRSTGLPRLYLYEFTNISFRSNGAPRIQGQQLATLSSDDWRRLVDAHGDFRGLGITLETNKPVEGFEEAWTKF